VVSRKRAALTCGCCSHSEEAGVERQAGLDGSCGKRPRRCCSWSNFSRTQGDVTRPGRTRTNPVRDVNHSRLSRTDTQPNQNHLRRPADRALTRIPGKMLGNAGAQCFLRSSATGRHVAVAPSRMSWGLAPVLQRHVAAARLKMGRGPEPVVPRFSSGSLAPRAHHHY